MIQEIRKINIPMSIVNGRPTPYIYYNKNICMFIDSPYTFGLNRDYIYKYSLNTDNWTYNLNKIF